MRLPVPLPIGIDDDPNESHRIDNLLIEMFTCKGHTYIPVPQHDDAYAQRLVREFDVQRECSPDIALIMATSGSTGTPKGALLSYELLERSACASAQVMGGSGAWMLAVPGYHIAGLNVMYRSLYAGYSPYRLDLHKGFHIENFIDAERNFRSSPQRYISLVPTQLHKIVNDTVALAALARFDGVLIGGAPTPLAIQEKLERAAIPTYYSYGMTETAGGCVYNGISLPGVTISLENVSDSGEGRIIVNGDLIAQGYRNVDSSPVFTFPQGSSSVPSFRTQDIGSFVQGKLRVHGRIDDIVNIAGLKINPRIITEKLHHYYPMYNSYVTAIEHPTSGNQLVAVIEQPHPLESFIYQEMALTLSTTLDKYAVPRIWVTLDQFPLLRSGKIDRLTLHSRISDCVQRQLFYSPTRV